MVVHKVISTCVEGSGKTEVVYVTKDTDNKVVVKVRISRYLPSLAERLGLASFGITSGVSKEYI